MKTEKFCKQKDQDKHFPLCFAYFLVFILCGLPYAYAYVYDCMLCMHHHASLIYCFGVAIFFK